MGSKVKGDVAYSKNNVSKVGFELMYQLGLENFDAVVNIEHQF